MKKYFTILTMALICCDLYSQHEYKISIGSAISGDEQYSNGIIDGSYNELDDFWNITYDNSYSNRIGLNINLEYSYYIKHNLKVSANLGYSQLGYRSTQNEYYGQSVGLNYVSENKINIDCLGTGVGMTLITKQGITFTMGYSAYTLDKTTLNQEGSEVYANNPGANSVFDETSNINASDTVQFNPLPLDFYIKRNNSAPFFGVGYEWGDFTIDCKYVMISNYAYGSTGTDYPSTVRHDLRSISLCIGYSKIIKSKK